MEIKIDLIVKTTLDTIAKISKMIDHFFSISLVLSENKKEKEPHK